MALFRVNNRPMKFHLIDIKDDERDVLEDAIKDLGGESTNDEESIIKFTSREAFGRNHYPRAQIYNAEFIITCMKEKRIVESNQFRLSTKVPGDEYLMEHFLFGRCFFNRNENLRPLALSNSTVATTQAATDNQEYVPSSETDGTMYTALSRGQSMQIVEDYVDESQAVVIPSDLEICGPTLAGGDAAKATTLCHEKRPCNVEYELVVQPKVATLERQARKLAAAKKSSVENRLLQRSLRTRSRRTNLSRTEETSPNNTENVDPEIDRIKEEPMLNLTNNSNSPDNMTFIKLKSNPEKKVTTSDKSSAGSNSGWTETRTCLAKENVPEVLTDIVIPANLKKKIKNIPIPTDCSKVINVCYKGLNAAAVTLENTRKQVLSKTPKRKLVHEISNDETTTSKQSKKNNQGAELLNSKRNTRKGEQDSSEDERYVDKKKIKLRRQTMYSDEDGNSRTMSVRVRESSDDEAEKELERRKKGKNSPKKNFTKTTMRRLLNLHDEENSFVTSKKKLAKSTKDDKHHDDSSDLSLEYSSDEDVSRSKHSRKKDANLSDSIDRTASVAAWRQLNKDLNEAGPSRVQDFRRIFHPSDKKDSSDDDVHSWDNFPNSRTTNHSKSHHARVEKAKDNKHIVVQQLQSDSKPTQSRGQKWRAQLISNGKERSRNFRSGPFSASERTVMIQYLITNKRISKAKGLVVWEEMIEDGFLSHRTPQSLQNQFRKHILPNIEDFPNLTVGERQQFLNLRMDKDGRNGR